jgi:hypothetical protein
MQEPTTKPSAPHEQIPEAARVRYALDALSLWDGLTDADYRNLIDLAHRHPDLSPDKILRLYQGESYNRR